MNSPACAQTLGTRAGLEFVEKVITNTIVGLLTEWNAMVHVPQRRIGRAGYWLRVDLVVVDVAHPRDGPSSSATTSTGDRAPPASAHVWVR